MPCVMAAQQGEQYRRYSRTYEKNRQVFNIIFVCSNLGNASALVINEPANVC